MSNNAITVVDAICNAGKNSWDMQKIKEPFGGRFIYVTPYLDEYFKEPITKNIEGLKIKSLRDLVESSENIVCTHELFKLCDKDILEQIKK